MKKFLVAIFSAVMVMMLFTGCGKENVKIGYMNIEKVLSDAPKIKQINETNQQKLNELERQDNALEQKKSSMKSDEYQKQKQQIQTQYMGLRQQYDTQLKQTMDAVLSEISQEESLDAILPKDTATTNGFQVQTKTFVVDGGMDVTDKVIKKLQ